MEILYFFADFFIYHEPYTNETRRRVECIGGRFAVLGSRLLFKVSLNQTICENNILDFRNPYRNFQNKPRTANREPFFTLIKN